MIPQPFVVTTDNYDRALNVVGTKVNVLAPNTATKGYEITIQEGDEGTGPPPHSHPWDESFFVIKGSLQFSYEGNSVRCDPGTLVHLPAGTVHSFCYGPGGGEMLEITGQGSSASKMFASLDKKIPPGPPDIPKIIEVLEEHGVTVAG